jgi:hypothetical protein
MHAPLRFLLLISIALIGPGCGGPGKSASKKRELTPREIVERYKPAVVRIENDMQGTIGVGTGFIVRPDGRIATNLHVIAGGGALKVRLSDGTEHTVKHVVAIDPARDLAIIDIEASKLPTLTLGDSDAVSPGDQVIAIGNPMRLDFTVSDGLISSVRALDQDTVLQISAPISQGSSGGPLFDRFGKVIGVATLVSAQGQNLNFGVPINYLRPMLDHEGGESVQEFAKRFKKSTGPRVIETPNGTIVREVPRHELSLLEGCSDEQLSEVYSGISRAIELGAPVYNKGDHEACFVIYQQTAVHFEKDDKLCKGVRDAFGQGLLKAETKEGFTAKAWTMRDTFDGLLAVLVRKASGG